MTRSLVGFLGVTSFMARGLALLALGLACDEPAPDLAEWTVDDHTHQTEKKQRRPGPVTKPSTYAQPSKRNQLVEVTWQKQCANCHGKRGKGDGPQSPMVKARDLSVAEWQSSVTDDQIMTVIKAGKGKMPAFNFPESMLTGLVAHVREFPSRAARKGFPQGRDEAAGGAAGASAAAAPPPAAPAEEEEESTEGGEAAHQ
jgi:hypothetical protein